MALLELLQLLLPPKYIMPVSHFPIKDVPVMLVKECVNGWMAGWLAGWLTGWVNMGTLLSS